MLQITSLSRSFIAGAAQIYPPSFWRAAMMK